METYVSVFEEYLTSMGLPVAQVTVGIIGILTLITVLALIGSGRKSGQLSRERAKNAEDLTRITQDLQTAHAQLEHAEQLALQRLDSLRTLTAGFNALPVSKSSDDLETLPEDALWEMNAASLIELTEKFQGNAAKIAKLAEQNHHYKSHLDKLELARMSTFNELNLAMQKTKELDQNLQQAAGQLTLATDKIQQLEAELNAKQQQLQDNAVNADRLQAENTELQANLAKHEQDHKQSENQLASAMEQIQQLQSELARKNQHTTNTVDTSTKLQSEHSALQAEIAQIKQGHAQAIKDLNLAQQKITDLENDLRKQATKPATQATVPTLAKPLAEESKQPGQLFGKFLKTVRADLNLGKQQIEAAMQEQSVTSTLDAKVLAEKDATIENLKAELAAQQNHIARLERDVEAQQGTQTTLENKAARPETDEPHSPNRPSRSFESLLADAKLPALSGGLEKITHQLFDPVKEKMDEATNKVLNIPEQLKGIYQKLSPFK